jgi:hypothetical protein
MDDDVTEFSMSVPLDEDGFLRRQCPTCERVFKRLAAQGDEDQGAEPPEDGYFCPYCAVQAPLSAWHTERQIEQARAVVMREKIGPMLDDFKRSVEGSQGSGLVQANVNYDLPDAPEPMTEDASMRRVDFACHPGQSVKVRDDWTGPVHCLICGTRV